ncbi:MAG: DUF305 domain-containing protein [Phycicoccus sp.]
MMSTRPVHTRARTARSARRAAVPTAALALVLVITGCGGEHSTAGGHDMPAGGGSSSASDHNAADVMFAQMMVPHHEQAVEMADLVPDRSDSPEVEELAAEIRAAQQPEIDTMSGWLEQWGADMSMSGGHSMGGMMSDADLAELGSLRGAAFDRRWLAMMIEHHEGAVDMAKDQIRGGASAPAKELARVVVSTQQAEIDRMRSLL